MSLHKGVDRMVTLDGLKNINELKVGDLVPSPDQKYKKIISVSECYDEIFELKTKNNQSIYSKKDGYIYIVSTTTKKSEKSYKPDFIIPVSEYISKSKTFKHLYKLKSNYFNFGKEPVVMDSYFLGVLLGDGHIGSSIGVTTIDKEIIDEVYRQAEIFNLKIRISNGGGNGFNSYYLSSGTQQIVKNSLIIAADSIGIRHIMCGNKFIPELYKSNSKEDRLQVLAGLIDTDGSRSNSVFDYISKSKQLAEDVCFLSRSLGLRATIRECVKSSQNGTKSIYHRVTISGNTDIVPVRIQRKKCSPRLQKKSPNRFGFVLTRISTVERFYEVRVGGDGLYLNEEFMVCAS